MREREGMADWVSERWSSERKNRRKQEGYFCQVLKDFFFIYHKITIDYTFPFLDST